MGGGGREWEFIRIVVDVGVLTVQKEASEMTLGMVA
jgi:hypothetical protein